MSGDDGTEAMTLHWDTREEDTIEAKIRALEAEGWVKVGSTSLYAKMHTTTYQQTFERRSGVSVSLSQNTINPSS